MGGGTDSFLLSLDVTSIPAGIKEEPLGSYMDNTPNKALNLAVKPRWDSFAELIEICISDGIFYNVL